MKSDPSTWLERDSLTRTGPDRGAANYFRSAAHDGKGKDGKAIGGIPLNSAEAAVVAAVRMAYRVAEAQVDRSARLARRLREAGDQATGARSDRQALDATERLVFRAMMGVLGWVEAATTDNSNPLRRLFAAEYRLLGSLLGLTPAETPSRQEARAPEAAARRAGARRSAAASPAEQPGHRSVRIQHTAKERRAVQVSVFEYTGDLSRAVALPVEFYNVERASPDSPKGHVIIDARRSVTLRIDTSGSIAGGRWRAALCDADGLQVGQVEIVL